MGLKEFRIVFDNPLATYYVGQSISGKVVLALETSKRLRAIRVRIQGVANACWTSERDEENSAMVFEDENAQTMGAHEEFFNYSMYVLGSATSTADIHLPPGQHVYLFNYTLPTEIPSSFETGFGHSRYTVKAYLERPWTFDYEVKKPFTVICPFDLNAETEAPSPVTLTRTKKFFQTFCCTSAPLTISASIPTRGYVCGQIIPVKVRVENKSGVTLRYVAIFLEKLVIYKAYTPRVQKREEVFILAQQFKGPIRPRTSTNYEQFILIPPTPPTNLTQKHIIEYQYLLKVVGWAQGILRFNLNIDIPLFIGTIPLKNAQNLITKRDDNKNEVQEGMTNLTAAKTPFYNLYPNLPLPYYDHSPWKTPSIREKDESEDCLGIRDQWSPRYPTFNFKSL